MIFEVKNISKISTKSDHDFMFPVLAETGSDLVHDHHFIPMLDPPGAFYVAPKEKILVSRIVTQCLKLWPLLVMSIFLSMVAGFIAWLLESRENAAEFPRSFFRGWLEGNHLCLGMSKYAEDCIHKDVFIRRSTSVDHGTPLYPKSFQRLRLIKIVLPKCKNVAGMRHCNFLLG